MMDAFMKYSEIPPFVQFGYEPKTTFWGDFGVVDILGGESAIRDTFKNAFKFWKDDQVYATELAMVLNHKAWEWDAKRDNKLRDLYVELWQKVDSYIMKNWKGEKLSYYLKVTD